MSYNIRELEKPINSAMQERIILTRKRFFTHYGIVPDTLELELQGPVFGYAADEMCFRLMAMVYGIDEPTVRHEYPTTWWDAVKLRFFPEWALKRWPPGLTVVVVERGVIYPQLSRHTGPGRSAARLEIIGDEDERE